MKAKRENFLQAKLFRGNRFEEAEIIFFSYWHDLMLGSGDGKWTELAQDTVKWWCWALGCNTYVVACLALMTCVYISVTWLYSSKILVNVSYLCRAVHVASHVGNQIFPQFWDWTMICLCVYLIIPINLVLLSRQTSTDNLSEILRIDLFAGPCCNTGSVLCYSTRVLGTKRVCL